MALINCPECGKEISDKSQACVHCGCPVEKITSNEISITRKDLFERCDGDVIQFRQVLIEDYGYDEELVEMELLELESGLDGLIDDFSKLDNTPKQVDVPKCPTCQSTNVERIGALDKIGSAGLFGVFAIGHISKTFRCKNCKYKW